MAGKTSYADKLRAQMEHAPVESTRSEAIREQQGVAKDDTVEPELVAAVTNMGKFSKIHPTKATQGENLPKGYTRSSTGFLLSNEVVEVRVNQKAVRHASDHLRKFSIVVYFVGGKQSASVLASWLADIQVQVGFFQISSRQELVTQRLLMLTPHRSRWRTCIL